LASVQNIIAPDFYMSRTQTQFAQYFASLIISRAPGTPGKAGRAPSPTYRISIITNSGAQLPPITVPTSIPDGYTPPIGGPNPAAPQAQAAASTSSGSFTLGQSLLGGSDVLA
jgi:hypothetical protein